MFSSSINLLGMLATLSVMIATFDIDYPLSKSMCFLIVQICFLKTASKENVTSKSILGTGHIIHICHALLRQVNPGGFISQIDGLSSISRIVSGLDTANFIKKPTA